MSSREKNRRGRGGSPEEGGAHDGEDKVVRRNLLAGLERLAPADDDRGHEAGDAGRDVHDVATLRAKRLVIGQTGQEPVPPPLVLSGHAASLTPYQSDTPRAVTTERCGCQGKMRLLGAVVMAQSVILPSG